MEEVVVGDGGGKAWPELGRSSPAMVAGGGWSGVGVRLGSLGGEEEVKKEMRRKEKKRKRNRKRKRSDDGDVIDERGSDGDGMWPTWRGVGCWVVGRRESKEKKRQDLNKILIL